MNFLYLDTISTDNLIHIFDYLNTTKLKLNQNMSLNDVLELIWEVQKIQKRQKLYFTEINCLYIIRELRLKKKNNYVQQYFSIISTDYVEYEYLYYD
jgi:hypothetical protein